MAFWCTAKCYPRESPFFDLLFPVLNPLSRADGTVSFQSFLTFYFHRRRWRSYILNTRWSWPNICGSGSYLGSASRLVGYQTWSSSFIICIYWYWTWTVGAFGVVVRRRVHGAPRVEVFVEAEEYRRRNEVGEMLCNPLLFLLCDVPMCVCTALLSPLWRVYHSFVFFSFFFFSTISLSLSPSCAVLWMMDSFVSKLSVLLQGLVVYYNFPYHHIHATHEYCVVCIFARRLNEGGLVRL